MTEWPATLAICRRELAKGDCCLGLNAKAHGWCSVDRHAEKWIECGMEPPAKRGEEESMKGEILPPVGLTGSEVEWRPPEGLSPMERQRAWGRSFQVVYRAGVAAIVTAGRILIEAKAEIPKGEWAGFIEFDTPISNRTAQKLMQVASDPNILRYMNLDAPHGAHLPDDRNVLVELCGLESEQFDGLIEDGTIHAEMRRGDLRRHLIERRHEEVGGAPPLADLGQDQYRVILADPPWRYRTWSGEPSDRSAENHYPTMTLDEIAAKGTEIIGLSARDCWLFMWVPAGPRRDYETVMEAWGFEPKGDGFVWVKNAAPGLGHSTRKRHELCLYGTRGSPQRQAADVDTVIEAARRRHSQKPEEIYSRIERFAAGPYLELFGREPREGWTVWGNDPALREEAE